MDVPKAKRAQTYGTVTVDPELSNLLALANTYDAKKVANYGQVMHRISWGPAVGGKDLAVMGDCEDQTKSGVYEVATTTIITSGPSRANEQITFARTRSGWKVAAVLSLKAGTC